jgi:anaerobic ribonucleoside-triphosphate reductase activating protein
VNPNKKLLQLNLASEMPSSLVNGPGCRYVLWVQGCPSRCSGCFNQDFLPFLERNVVTVDALADRILSTRGIEGVTYSGGEPTSQAEALAALTLILKQHKLTIMCYSGFIYLDLLKRHDVHITQLLSLTDIFIDGPFIQEKSANLIWRGSSNQNVYFLTDYYKQYQAHINDPISEMELVIGNNQIVSTGIINAEVLQRLEKLLGNKLNRNSRNLC